MSSAERREGMHIQRNTVYSITMRTETRITTPVKYRHCGEDYARKSYSYYAAGG